MGLRLVQGRHHLARAEVDYIQPILFKEELFVYTLFKAGQEKFRSRVSISRIQRRERNPESGCLYGHGSVRLPGTSIH